MKPKVTVLLSTYNGEKYIKELIDSVLNQIGVEVLLQVRDDGSTDSTIQLLESYNDSRIKIIRGNKNLGPAKSFLTLLHDCDRSEYYAYCDQDDVWYPQKLLTAVNAINGNDEPTLFISTYDVVDEQLNKLYTYDMKFENPLRIQDTILYRAPSACNMVFNDKLRVIIKKKVPDNARMHDFWTLLVAQSNKCKIITKQIPLIKYRQHDNETVGIKPTRWTAFKRLVRSTINGNNERWRQAKELYETYYTEMDNTDKEIVERIVNYRNSLSSRLSLIQDKRYITQEKYINMLFRISVLLGVF